MISQDKEASVRTAALAALSQMGDASIRYADKVALALQDNKRWSEQKSCARASLTHTLASQLAVRSTAADVFAVTRIRQVYAFSAM